MLIHAAKGMTRAEYGAAEDPLWSRGGPTIELPAFGQLQRGGIVGVATIDACIHPADRTSMWHMDGQYGFHLVNVKPLPFVECKGALGFFDVPPEVATQLRQMNEMGRTDALHAIPPARRHTRHHLQPRPPARAAALLCRRLRRAERLSINWLRVFPSWRNRLKGPRAWVLPAWHESARIPML
ncbi:hypothetical protein [Paraburkholderia sp. BL10I2N1]|uniref:hypothetical protein n=1 Tax=Paraburkholderia sp. BL10I2N1 TaxID=1938796 RepID=UPI001FB66EB6|nr:hypothetical protein [Paraburkholderia sp. BL10I2N1]